MICDLYKAHSAEKGEEPVTDEQKRRAHFAWELLRLWHQPPGVDEALQVKAEELREWIATTRMLASERDRQTVADQHIGNVLYYYPPDPSDLAWPHIELRNLIEELQSDDIEKGIAIEQYNSRGVVSHGLYEGGDKERTIAEQWRRWLVPWVYHGPEPEICLNALRRPGDREATYRDVEAEKQRLLSG